ncbi:MAG: pyridoxal-phosphate-dependent aminotransferase family protein [Planctomycetota bacterium]
MKKNYMFTPGPTMVPQEVLLEEAAPMIHHRTDRFSAIMAEVNRGLQKLFGTEQTVFVIMGTGTAAMEAAVVNVCSPGDKVLYAPGGKFGERWGAIAEAYGCRTVPLPVEWGESLAVDDASAALAEHPDAKAMYVTHSETSTGALTDVRAIAALTRETDVLLGVDSITSIGVHPFELDEWGVDLAVSGSQKGCMVPPGLSFIAVSLRTWDAVEACESPTYYLDLKAMRKRAADHQTPFTGAVSLVRGLRRALQMMDEEGLQAVFARHARLARATRAAVKALGLRLVADTPANGVTAVYGPEGVNTGDLVNLMREKFGVTIAGGQADLKGKIFRVGHMGYVSEEDLLLCIGTLERALRELGYEFELGAGVQAVQEVLV